MYLAGRWYTLDLSKTEPADRTHAATLDVARLQRSVLEGTLGIGDVRTDKRIDFVGGARGTSALEQAVDTSRAAVTCSRAGARFPSRRSSACPRRRLLPIAS